MSLHIYYEMCVCSSDGSDPDIRMLTATSCFQPRSVVQTVCGPLVGFRWCEQAASASAIPEHGLPKQSEKPIEPMRKREVAEWRRLEAKAKAARKKPAASEPVAPSARGEKPKQQQQQKPSPKPKPSPKGKAKATAKATAKAKAKSKGKGLKGDGKEKAAPKGGKKKASKEDKKESPMKAEMDKYIQKARAAGASYFEALAEWKTSDERHAIYCTLSDAEIKRRRY